MSGAVCMIDRPGEGRIPVVSMPEPPVDRGSCVAGDDPARSRDTVTEVGGKRRVGADPILGVTTGQGCAGGETGHNGARAAGEQEEEH